MSQSGEFERFTSPNGQEWIEINSGPLSGRMPRRNICSVAPGVKRGIHPVNESELFLMIMDGAVNEAVRFTNLEARRVMSSLNRRRQLNKLWKAVNKEEMNAFIGLHILARAFKSQCRDTESLWS